MKEFKSLIVGAMELCAPAFPNCKAPPYIQNITVFPGVSFAGAKTFKYRQSSLSAGGGLLKTVAVTCCTAAGAVEFFVSMRVLTFDAEL